VGVSTNRRRPPRPPRGSCEPRNRTRRRPRGAKRCVFSTAIETSRLVRRPGSLRAKTVRIGRHRPRKNRENVGRVLWRSNSTAVQTGVGGYFTSPPTHHVEIHKPVSESAKPVRPCETKLCILQARLTQRAAEGDHPPALHAERVRNVVQDLGACPSSLAQALGSLALTRSPTMVLPTGRAARSALSRRTRRSATTLRDIIPRLPRARAQPGRAARKPGLAPSRKPLVPPSPEKTEHRTQR